MSLLRKLAGQTAIYGFSSVLGRMLNVILVPLYTTVFVPGEYGIITECYAGIAFLNILYVHGLETAYFKFSASGKGEFYFNLSFTSILFSSVVLSMAISVFSSEIADALYYPGGGHFIIWLAWVLFTDAIVAIPFARLRKEGKAMTFAFLKLCNLGTNIFFNLFFLVFCPNFLSDEPGHILHTIYDPDFGVGYIFLSNLIANATYLLYFFPLWLKTKITVNKAEWKKMMAYAWPILIIGFASTFNEMFSRAILKYRLPEGFYLPFTNLEILGIFGACYKISTVMVLIVQAFRYAFDPFLFAKAKEAGAPELFRRVMTSFVILASFSWLIISVLLPYLAPIFLRQENYLLALDAVPWLLGGGLLLGVFYNLSVWYKLTNKTIYGAYIALIGSLATFLLNWTLIPLLGYIGSAAATVASYFIMVVTSFWWGKKHYPVPYNLKKAAGYICLAFFGILLNAYLPGSLIYPFLIIIGFSILTFIFERDVLLKTYRSTI